ncbi:hypothetical protein MJH12_02020 [bacterium]|nr:hypothetical protein [bacterium]
MWSKLILSISTLVFFLFLNGCGEQGNTNLQSQDQGQTGIVNNSEIKTVDIYLSLQQPKNSRSNRSVSRAVASVLPNLVQFRITISSDSLADRVSTYDSSQTSAKITLLIGHIYTATLAAVNSQGEVFAEGSSNIDLMVAPTDNSPKFLKIAVAPVNLGNISVTLIPETGSNIIDGQQVYFYINQPGSIYYSVNNEAYQQFENVSSTVGQKLSISNGQMISIPSQTGTTVSIKYQGESLVVQNDGTSSLQLGPLKEAIFQIIQITKVKQYVDSQARGKLMTGANFGVAQLIPIHR